MLRSIAGGLGLLLIGVRGHLSRPGRGLIDGSFMIGSGRWGVIGVVMIAFGICLLAAARYRDRGSACTPSPVPSNEIGRRRHPSPARLKRRRDGNSARSTPRTILRVNAAKRRQRAARRGNFPEALHEGFGPATSPKRPRTASESQRQRPHVGRRHIGHHQRVPRSPSRRVGRPGRRRC